jgi:hypothetical protein
MTGAMWLARPAIDLHLNKEHGHWALRELPRLRRILKGSP